MPETLREGELSEILAPTHARQYVGLLAQQIDLLSPKTSAEQIATIQQKLEAYVPLVRRALRNAFNAKLREAFMAVFNGLSDEEKGLFHDQVVTTNIGLSILFRPRKGREQLFDGVRAKLEEKTIVEGYSVSFRGSQIDEEGGTLVVSR